MMIMIEGGNYQLQRSGEVTDDMSLRKSSRTFPLPPSPPTPYIKKSLPRITGAYSLLIDPIPLEQFGAFAVTGQLTKEQEVISTERAQNVIFAKNTSCNAWR